MILNGSLRKYDPSEFTWAGEIKFTLEEENYKRLKDFICSFLLCLVSLPSLIICLLVFLISTLFFTLIPLFSSLLSSPFPTPQNLTILPLSVGSPEFPFSATGPMQVSKSCRICCLCCLSQKLDSISSMGNFFVWNLTMFGN